MEKDSWDEYRRQILSDIDRVVHALSDVDRMCSQINEKLIVVENEVKHLIAWTINKDKCDVEFGREQIRGRWSLIVAITAGILGLIGSLFAIYLKKL